MEKKISPRKPHFSSEEVDVIVEGVQENYSNLFGALSPYLDQNKKKALWSSIVQKYVYTPLNILNRHKLNIKPNKSVTQRLFF